MIMKNYILLLIAFFTLVACSEDELDVYQAGNYLNFVKNPQADSLFISFFFHPDKEEIEIPIELELTGRILEEDKEIKISVDELSNVTEDDVVFPDKFVFRANKTVDTVYVTIKKTPKLDSDTCKLVLNIEDNFNFKRGKLTYCKSKIYFTSTVSKPDWWDSDIEKAYLGEFSAAKYTLFCQVTGVTDLTDVELSMVRQYALTFKRYLVENPTQEEDGSWMEVTVIG